ncbi:hypothetical protein CALCODRAFT_513599 [Calocera cornea HHB12733]|uniref:Uncharacterized protein n=1 Tax=Calocera cornea HHB12733 TaxID=1353952 RepID=A0A166MPM3_9BASI|nr:hypothetical protein CALCODRAFT_513599 [Calocera cornea HHB12733]
MEHPEEYGPFCNYKVCPRKPSIAVSEEMLDEAARTYAPADHPVFDMVPVTFDEAAQDAYSVLGSPLVSWGTFWEIYLGMQLALSEAENAAEIFEDARRNEIAEETVRREVLEVLPGRPACGPANIGGAVNTFTALNPTVEENGRQQAEDEISSSGNKDNLPRFIVTARS